MSCNSDYHDDHINTNYKNCYHGEDGKECNNVADSMPMKDDDNDNGTTAYSDDCNTVRAANSRTSTELTLDRIEISLSNSIEGNEKSVVQYSSTSTKKCNSIDINLKRSANNSTMPSSMNMLELTPELQIQCLTYLHPRDIISFGCCNKSSYTLVHGTKTKTTKEKNYSTGTCSNENNTGGETSFSEILWLHLWNRDYAPILNTWDVAQDAMKKSLSNVIQNTQTATTTITNCENLPLIPKILLSVIPSTAFPPSISKDKFISSMATLQKQCTDTTIIPTMKEFYLVYSQTWLNYTIAGHSTFTSCYTGLHGHVFNITNFVDKHPGAPESILLQGGGRDATSFFEAVGHSLSARKIAVRELVEVVDLSCCSGYGDVGIHDEDMMNDISNYNGGKMTFFSSLYGLGKRKEREQKDMNEKKNKDQWPLTGLSSTLPDDLSLIPKHRSRPKRTMGTLYHLREKLKGSEKRAQLKARQFMTKMKYEMNGNLNLYFDPFDGRWHGWYLNAQFDAVFIHDLKQR